MNRKGVCPAELQKNNKEETIAIILLEAKASETGWILNHGNRIPKTN